MNIATVWEWLGYVGGSVVVVAFCGRLFGSDREMPRRNADKPEPNASAVPMEWPSLEAWLDADVPAAHDFLGNYSVAERLHTLLLNGARSVGILGPFGSGKTSIVEWMGAMDNDSLRKPPQLIWSQHSCWGFESSASAINTMLTSGIVQIGEYIDTYGVNSLPEAYRQVFSAGGQWLDSIAKLFFAAPNLVEQFRRLSGLLQAMGTRLVIVVEDLDRNDSRSFDIQEIFAFLQQLKQFNNLTFVLTAGFASGHGIVFTKLCDHIEYLKPVSVNVSKTLVCTLRTRSLDIAVFPHEILSISKMNIGPILRWMSW